MVSEEKILALFFLKSPKLSIFGVRIGSSMVSTCRTGSPSQVKSVTSWGCLLLHFRLHSHLCWLSTAPNWPRKTGGFSYKWPKSADPCLLLWTALWRSMANFQHPEEHDKQLSIRWYGQHQITKLIFWGVQPQIVIRSAMENWDLLSNPAALSCTSRACRSKSVTWQKNHR